MARFFLLLSLLFLNACATPGFWPTPQPGPPRALTIYHKWTGERAEGTYFDGRRYNNSVLEKFNHILRDREADEVGDIDPRLYDALHELLATLALPENEPIEIVNGYRNPERNRKMAKHNKSVARESLHTKGQAVDIRLMRVPPKTIAEMAKTMQIGGVSHYGANHAHIDIGTVRTWRGR